MATATMLWDHEAGFWAVTDEYGDRWEVVANRSATCGRAAAACEREGECRCFWGDGSAEGGELSLIVHEGDPTTFTDDESAEWEVVGRHWVARQESK